MRMFTEVGRRVRPHCTAVGKAMLAAPPSPTSGALLARTGMPAHTVAHHHLAPTSFVAELTGVRRRGYAVDDGEQEIGVRCIAVAVPDAPTPRAISVSGPTERMTPELVVRSAPALRDIAARLSAALHTTTARP